MKSNEALILAIMDEILAISYRSVKGFLYTIAKLASTAARIIVSFEVDFKNQY